PAKVTCLTSVWLYDPSSPPRKVPAEMTMLPSLSSVHGAVLKVAVFTIEAALVVGVTAGVLVDCGAVAVGVLMARACGVTAAGVATALAVGVVVAAGDAVVVGVWSVLAAVAPSVAVTWSGLVRLVAGVFSAARESV